MPVGCVAMLQCGKGFFRLNFSEDFVAQWRNPLTLQPEQSTGGGGVLP